MKRLVGILPASGKANRIGGIPKFCLPVEQNLTLIQWHVNQMLEVCDEVRISTRSIWMPLLSEMKIDATLIEIEPSTMSDAVYRMSRENEELIIGMPDTFIYGATTNVYSQLMTLEADIVLGVWECAEYLKGKVGQVSIDEKTKRITGSMDKSISCNFPLMWGIIRFNLARDILDRSLNHPGEQFQALIDAKYVVKGQKIQGKYFDLGNFSVLKELYSIL